MAEIKREIVSERITIKATYTELSSTLGFTVENLEDYGEVVRFSVKINNISGYFEIPMSSFISMFVNDIAEEGYTVEIDNNGDDIEMFIDIEN